MIPAADGGGSAPAPSMRDFKKGAEALTNFKKRVDAILKDISDNPSSVADLRIAPTAFSAGTAPFAEAQGLHTQYSRVQHELSQLSQTLNDQIEAMGIAVHGAEVGFGNLEESEKRKFWAIQERARNRAEAAEKAREGQGGEKPAAGDDQVGY